MKIEDAAAALPNGLFDSRGHYIELTPDRVDFILSCAHEIGATVMPDGTREVRCFKCDTRYADITALDPDWHWRTKMNDTADNVTPIRKTDEAIAAEIRAELTPILDAAAAVMNKGRAAGLTVNFGMGLDAYGRYKVAMLDILKPL